MKNKIFIYIYFIIAIFLFANCTENYNESAESQIKKNFNGDNKHLNVTILLDLSDRISSKKNPTQSYKDIEFILNVIDVFKKILEVKNVGNSKDRIKLLYYPTLDKLNSELYFKISSLTDSLNFKFDEMDLIKRKNVFYSITKTYEENLKNLYSIFSNLPENYYQGSDLFNYFKHRVTTDCVDGRKNYVNLLIILTDGYLYSYDSKMHINNRYSYIGPLSNHLKKFRNMMNWETVFETEDYGFIRLNNDLSNIRIIAAEFNPVKDYPIDFDIMKKYWSKWFEEQQINKSNYLILRTDHISQNKDVVNNFIKKIVFE